MAAKQPDVTPHSLEAERAVLGGIILDPRQLPLAAAVLMPSSFFRDAHQRIYKALLALSDRTGEMDLVLLTDQLRKHEDLDEVGGPAYVASLVDGMAKSANVPHYAEIVAENARLREIIKVAAKTMEASYRGTEASAFIVEQASSGLLHAVPAAGGAVLLQQEVAQYYGRIVSGTMPEPVPTGYHDVDALLKGGFRPGDLVIVAARPSVGKTAWVTTMLDYVVRVMGRGPGLLFSLEMSAEQIAARMLAIRTHVPVSRIETGDVTPAEAERIALAVGEDDAPLWVECSSSTPTQVAAWCRRIRQQHGPLCVVGVDYMQMMSSGLSRDNEEGEMASVSRALKRIAKQENTVLVALSQLSRAPEGRKDKRPQLSDLRGSGALEQDADVAVLLYRGEMHGDADSEGIAEAIVAKNRNGATGTRRLAFVKELALFGNLQSEE